MSIGRCIVLLCLQAIVLSLPITSFATEIRSGEEIFIQHCSGCHINGGNIVRRDKTLKLKALKRRGLDNPEAIARIARIGIGNMGGYEEAIGLGNDQIVADWIWEQAQNAWVQQ